MMSIICKSRVVLVATAALAIAVFTATSTAAQQPVGPQTPPKQPDVVRIPNRPMTPPNSAADQPAIPPEEIIRRFSAQEDQLAKLFPTYAYRKTVRLEEIGPDGKASGSEELATGYTVTSEGVKPLKQTGEGNSTLKALNLERDDMEALSRIPTLPFGTQALANYQLTYQGKQLLDELTTYVFQIKPRQVDRRNAYFDGLLWVDDHDLAIVKTYGRWVTDAGDLKPDPQLPFTIFETYRQPVDNKYWLPAYSRSDGSVDNRGAYLSVRLIIRWDQYTPIPPGANAASDKP